MVWWSSRILWNVLYNSSHLCLLSFLQCICNLWIDPIDLHFFVMPIIGNMLGNIWLMCVNTYIFYFVSCEISLPCDVWTTTCTFHLSKISIHFGIVCHSLSSQYVFLHMEITYVLPYWIFFIKHTFLDFTCENEQLFLLIIYIHISISI